MSSHTWAFALCCSKWVAGLDQAGGHVLKQVRRVGPVFQQLSFLLLQYSSCLQVLEVQLALGLLCLPP